MGPVGQRLTENLVNLRKRNRIKQQDLARLLDTVGRPITSSALSRVEQGERRVDVDDLVALAVALDVTPNHLLLTEDASDELVELTPAVTATRERAWQWASGDLPLRDTPPQRDEAGRLRLGDLAKVEARRPHEPIASMSFEQTIEHLQVLAEVRRAVRAAEAQGLTRRQVFNGINFLDDLAGRGIVDALDEG